MSLPTLTVQRSGTSATLTVTNYDSGYVAYYRMEGIKGSTPVLLDLVESGTHNDTGLDADTNYKWYAVFTELFSQEIINLSTEIINTSTEYIYLEQPGLPSQRRISVGSNRIL